MLRVVRDANAVAKLEFESHEWVWPRSVARVTGQLLKARVLRWRWHLYNNHLRQQLQRIIGVSQLGHCNQLKLD